MTGPTDADRERARRVVTSPGMWVGTEGTWEDNLTECVAHALAEERDKARAEFLRLADVLDIGSNIYGDSARRVTNSDITAELVTDAVKAAAETIRQYVARRDAGQEP